MADLDFTGVATGNLSDKLQGYSGNIDDRRLLQLLEFLFNMQTMQGKGPTGMSVRDPLYGESSGNLAKLLGLDDIPSTPPVQQFSGAKFY